MSRILLPLLVWGALISGCSGQKKSENTETPAGGGLEAAQQLYDAGDFAAADSVYGAMISAKADDALAYSGRGKARMSLGQYELSIADHDKALELAVSQGISGAQLGQLHFNRGLTHYVYARFGSAITDFQAAVNNGFDLGNSYAYLGVCVGNSGDDITAIQHLNKAVENDPENHFSRSNRGYYNSKLGDNRTAIADFSKAIELDPKDKASYLNRGYTYIGMGDYESAIVDFQRSLDIDPEYMGALAYMGIALTNTGRPAEAVPYLDKAIQGTPDNPTLYYYRGAALINSGNLEAGCNDLHHAVANGDPQGLSMIEEYCK